jgi:hypothetical protein
MKRSSSCSGRNLSRLTQSDPAAHDPHEFMTIEELEHARPRFDIGFQISSFEDDGLGLYGDPLDPDAG